MNNMMDFPILDTQVYNHRLVYLDNAATTQKPRAVIETLTNYYLTLNSNIHRGAHYLAAQATERYEGVRRQVQAFINARSSNEIVFTRGTTESINLVASSFGRGFLKAGDEVIVSGMEHHSNIVPWQLACELAGASLRVIPFSDEGVLDLDAYRALFSAHTRIVACTHVSNTLGTINPVKEIVDIAHSHGVPVLIDGAQAVAHMKVDVQQIGCDFYCFSGHKMYAPMGVGVMYGREELLSQLPPYQGGGEMIKDVTFERTIYNEAPAKFEAGTAAIAQIVGLGAALEYLSAIGMADISRYEHELTQYAMSEMAKIPGLRLIGTALEKAGVLSFVLEGHDILAVGEYLNSLGIVVRSGHHCAQPVLRHYGLEGTVRPTLAIYNSAEDVDALVRALWALSRK
jgi:cysteine desulfurase/selenocysteine lyase